MNGKRLTIERQLDAPVETIWKAWTDPDAFGQWYGPSGATIPVAEMDVRVGGRRRICMEVQTPNGPMQMWFVGEHREVVDNALLVYTESMADADGNVISPASIGMPADHPDVTEVRVELIDLDGKTKQVVTHSGVSGESGAAVGWNAAFDKLETWASR